MQSKLIITCVTDGVEFQPVQVDCQRAITEQDWEMISKVLPIVLRKSEERLVQEMQEAEAAEIPQDQPSTRMTMVADFEVKEGNKE